ncbi:hypothetical protein CANINC_002871, partial [Pichia inconspicua]
MATVVLGSKRTILGGSAAQRKRKPGKSHQRNRSTNEDELIRTVDEDELALPITKTREEFQSTIALITNNKLNEKNSWEVPIVEYFHDMNILRGEDGSINFQTASTTLDGCTKIMSKRVDLIATEADSLLSLMKVKKKKAVVEDDDEDDPDYGPKKRVIKKTDVVETFNKLRVTDQQLDRVNIDPVFRKMVAEFDEGGTKSLLMNTLRISSDGQVMLDDAIPTGSEEVMNIYGDEDADAFGVREDKSMIKTDFDNELDREGDVEMKIVEDTEKIDELIKNFELVVRPEDINRTSLIPSLDKLRAYMENDDGDSTRSVFDFLGDNQIGKDKADAEMDFPDYQVEYDYDVENFDLEKDLGTNISEGTGFDDIPDFESDAVTNWEVGNDNVETVSRRLQREAEIMEALDRKMEKRLNRSHWKIRAINSRPQLFKFEDTEEKGSTTKKTTKQIKSAYVIDFMHDKMDESIFEKSTNDETRRDKSVVRTDETTLPDLKAWQADRLTECFIQPKRTLRGIYADSTTTLDRSYWAERYNDRNNDTLAYTVPGEEDVLHEAELDAANDDVDYGDMDPGVYDFDVVDAENGNANNGGNDNVKVEFVKGGAPRLKETIHYERRVKRINVRALKRNLWEVTRERGEVAKLSEVVRDTYGKYEGREREDLSTSFFFICMLHIANEEGLSVESTETAFNNELTSHRQNGSRNSNPIVTSDPEILKRTIKLAVICNEKRAAVGKRPKRKEQV